MFDRLLNLPTNRNLFLFGARNTGKSTLLEQVFAPSETKFFDLLDQDLEARFISRPNDLYDMVKALPDNIKYVVIDEVQKVPALLNVVHRLMKDKQKVFLMSGSSARKLRQEGVNLLAGRAFVYNLYPFCHLELKDKFELNSALAWGTLPEVFTCADEQEKKEFLMAYAHTYLKEEIAQEQLVRNLNPFRKFLEVAAQSNGKIINYSNIARDVNVDDKTVRNYFSILEDTLLGFILEPYEKSIRKRVNKKPKFYFFDTGITRALARQLTIQLEPGTSVYGDFFETFIINEFVRLTSYFRKDYKLSYLQTTSGQEIDLIIERPGEKLLLIEIKSTREIDDRLISKFKKISGEFDQSECLCLSNDPYAKKFDHVLALPWQEGLKHIFGY